MRILAGVIGAVGIVALAVLTYVDDSLLSLVMLTVSALIWVVFCILNGRGWSRALDRWHHTLLDWDEQQQLTKDLSNLLTEALQDLDVWDHEKARDIESRANTIIQLRVQNFQERDRQREESP